MSFGKEGRLDTDAKKQGEDGRATMETERGDMATGQWTPGAIRGWKRQDRVLP